MKSSSNKLELKNLSKIYKGNNFKSLDSISFELVPGVYGILGANGAGKSTLFNILSGLIKPSSGEILFNDSNIINNIEQFKGHMGYMPQNQMLYPSYTIKEYLTYMAVLKGIKKKKINKEIDRVLEITELINIKDRKISSLSGGMKQRLLISQALIADPDILILDEPTAGLDPKQRVIIRNFLSKISKDKIVLISTHVVSDIEHISKEIIIIKKSELILKERPDNILKTYENIAMHGEIDIDKSEEFLIKYNVSQMQIRSNGKNYIKIVGDFTGDLFLETKFTKAPVDLEDVYLYLFEGDKND